MAKFITADEAAELIPDGATVGLAGVGLSGWPEEVACAIRDRFIKSGHPRNLDLKQGSAMGDWKERGVTRFGEAGEGLIQKWSAAHVGSAFSLNKLVTQNKIQCHCLPQGVIVNLWREIAAGRPGLMTKVGLGTFVDPRIEGGKMNDITSDEIVEFIRFRGEEYLFYKSFPLHVALLRGTTADENGNISFEHESVWNEGLSVAMAAKNTGGIVIVQVEYVTQAGTISPKDVKIPGIFVDYIVQATDKSACWQTEGGYFEPSFSGQIKKPFHALPALPLGDRKVICRRCAAELRAGVVCNLGVGIPADVASVVAEEGYSNRVVLTAETGAVGGVPAALPNFGSSYNLEASMLHNDMFDMIDGGGLDIAILGLAQVDKCGNVNVSKFGQRLIGPGGFIDITQGTKKVNFCGNFMAASESEICDGKLVIKKKAQQKNSSSRLSRLHFPENI